MRADRLLAALLVLQARSQVTATELAAELEVSVKTARRDLEALQMAGVPVYARAGRGGGWQLVGGARTDLTGLTAGEARALFLATGPSSTLAPTARSALRKLLQAVPGPFREQAAAASRAVAVDPSRWGEHERRQPHHLDSLQDAVIDGHRVRMAYVDREGAATERTVDPLGLVDKDGVWYLLAGTPAGNRTFRVGRVRSLEILDEPVERPGDFDLHTAWAGVVDTVERQRTAVRATVLAPENLLGPLRQALGRHLVVGGRHPDGRVELSIGAAAPEQLAWQLAGWGSRLEVVEPAEVRDLLAEIGRSLTARYAAAPAR